MKRLFKSGLLMLFSAMTGLVQAQDRQMGDTTYYKTLIPETKQTLLKNMSFIANMRFAEQNEFYNGDFTKARFVNQQFRLELRGYVTDKVFFRLRDRYTRAQTSESVDNLSRSVDMAYIRVDMTKKWSLSAGKMCADWGAWEFDYNPIDVYEYSDIIEYADNFLTGVGLSYQATPKHQFTVQALDSRTKTFTELYDTVPGLVESEVPLAFVANWRGSLFNDKVKTIWSYSLFNEAKSTNMHYVALGTELTLGKFIVAYDFKWSDEQLDRTGLVSNIVPDNIYNYALKNTLYVGHWVHLHYRVTPKINLAMFGMLDIASWKNSAQNGGNTTGSNEITRNWGYIPTIEYYPYENLNLRFFLNYVGRMYDYSEYTESTFGAKDYSTGRLQIGFVSPLGVF